MLDKLTNPIFKNKYILLLLYVLTMILKKYITRMILIALHFSLIFLTSLLYVKLQSITKDGGVAMVSLLQYIFFYYNTHLKKCRYILSIIIII